MNPKELTELVQTMKALGVVHLKTAECDIELAPKALEPPPKELTPEEEGHIKNKMGNLNSLLQLNDQDLIDRLFPTAIPADTDEGLSS